MKGYILMLMIFPQIFFCSKKDTTIIIPKVSEVDLELVVDSVDIPWGLDFLPDGSTMYTEKEGMVYQVKEGKKYLVGNVPDVYYRGQGGLLDLRLHPDFSNNRKIYFSLSKNSPDGEGGNTAIVSAIFDGKELKDFNTIYQASPGSSKGYHFGSRIVFDDQGYLFFTIGDRGDHDQNPQDIKRDGGKVYRIHDDGRIPSDNPFYSTEGAKTAIWSYGHRNQQGMAIHPASREIWTNEHGPKGGDELNIIRKGANYGWPVITYGINYNGTIITDQKEKEGMEQPVYYWIPSIGPSGMCFISSSTYPDWQGNILIGSLSFSYLERLVMDGTKVVKREKLFENIGRVRNVVQAPDGYVYVAVESKGIFRMIPK